jgi:hypothetical protein
MTTFPFTVVVGNTLRLTVLDVDFFSCNTKDREQKMYLTKYHRCITSRFKVSISADVRPWGDISLLTAPPPTTSGVKSY